MGVLPLIVFQFASKIGIEMHNKTFKFVPPATLAPPDGKMLHMTFSKSRKKNE